MSRYQKKEGGAVWVGLSGGVDSATSAKLLINEGFSVSGAFIKVWQPDFLECTQTQDRQDAARVAAALSIPFQTIDLADVYKKEVVEYMIGEYKIGRTPNPDVFCNQSVKFGAFLARSLAHGAQYVATGHYARNIYNEKLELFELHAGVDKTKDQSYFLWTLTQHELSHILFPVGDLLKSEVRKKAKEFALPNAEKKDSQGLCFIGHIDLKEFLSHFIDTKAGVVLDTEGNAIGEHEGAVFYTLGQRHGFTTRTREIETKPHFVVSKNIEENTLTVSDNPHAYAEKHSMREVALSRVNWIGEVPKQGEKILARLRYRQPLFSCTLTEYTEKEKTARLALEKIQAHIPPGQSFVMYNPSGEVCLGGGIIEK